MIEVKAPLKVILFGEHAVVYNKPCLAMAIDKYVRVKIRRRNDEYVIIRSKNLGMEIKKSVENLYDRNLPYVTVAIEKAFEYIDKRFGFDMEIFTDAPISSGLGSSAAVSVCSIYSVLKAYGYEINKEEISRLAYEVELKVQGAASRTDTYISTFGGMHLIKGNKFERINSNLSLIIMDTGIKRRTKLLVKMVKRLYERNKDVVEKLFDTISRIVYEAKFRIENGEDISELMNINHGLLYSLGLSNNKVEKYRFEMLKSGCSGVKITGAGAGGCLIGYRKDYDYNKIIYRLKNISGFVSIVNTENNGVS